MRSQQNRAARKLLLGSSVAPLTLAIRSRVVLCAVTIAKVATRAAVASLTEVRIIALAQVL